jgi:5-methylcytosine-specific restriction endonuclease McrA
MDFRADITERKRAMSPEQKRHILRHRSTKNPKNQLAALRRAALIQALGGCCVKCGTDKRLEFDHKDPATRTWQAKSLNQYMRLIRYEQDAAAGLIQLLCKRDNQKKGDRVPQDNEPF